MGRQRSVKALRTLLNGYHVEQMRRRKNGKRSAMKLIAPLTLMMLVTSCGMIGAIDADQVCAGWSEIRGDVDDIDKISDTLAISIAAHNDFGSEVGCW